MQQRKHVLAAGMFLLVLVGLGGAEAYVLRDKLRGALLLPDTDIASPTPVLTLDGVAPADGAPVDDALAAHTEVEARSAKTAMFLTVLLPDQTVNIRDLFANDEYAGTIAWVETPEAKDEFLSLKEALLPAFSQQLTDLVDTTVRAPGAPTRNVLSFRDPALNPNHLFFMRSRNRLFELHATPGKEDDLSALVEDLAAK